MNKKKKETKKERKITHSLLLLLPLNLFVAVATDNDGNHHPVGVPGVAVGRRVGAARRVIPVKLVKGHESRERSRQKREERTVAKLVPRIKVYTVG
jgi:hypothetical protein